MAYDPNPQEGMTREEVSRRSSAALASRREHGEIMTYRQDGWMIREYPDRRIERLCPENEFDPAKYPLPPRATEELERHPA